MLRLLTLSLMIVTASLLAPCAAAQDPKPEPKPEAVEDPGIPADFNDYLRKLYPGLDPGGEHDLFALKDPQDKQKRHDYTVAMTQLLLAYMTTLDMGSTVSKVFDQYSRGKEGNQVTFKTLHAIVLLHYPPGQPNITEAKKLLYQATEQAKDYAYPWFLLAQYFEYPRLIQIPNTSPRETLAPLDKALEAQPDFLRATLLKCQVFMLANPPRLPEVKELIEPYFRKLPPVLDDLEDLMSLYWVTHTPEEYAAKLKELMDGGKLTNAQKIRCIGVQANQQVRKKQFDAAIETLLGMLKLVDTKTQPSDAVWVNAQLAMCYGGKAMDLRTADPELREPGNSELFEKLCADAAARHILCAEIERTQLPLALRGGQARLYVEFMIFRDRAEQALDWLTTYLNETDLSSAQRTVLKNLHDKLGIIVNPTEEGMLTLYEGYLAEDDMENLAISFGIAVRKIKEEGLHFKTERALKLFISQLDNRVRITAGFAAFLAADTALQIGGEAPKQAGEAIATRYEKETELNSDEQGKVQADLCEAIRLTAHRPSQERGIRHAAKLIEDSTALNIDTIMLGIFNVWADEAFRKALKTSPAKPRVSEKTKARPAAEWLRKLADAVKAEEVKPEGQ